METSKQHIGRTAGKRGGKIFVFVTMLLATASLLVFSLRPQSKSEPNKTSAAAILDDPLGVVLTPQTGDGRTDKEISRLQQQIRSGRNVQLWLEQLGWAFVAKARESFDAGFYKLAEQCARCIEKRNPQSQEAMLLRGHVLQNLHRFKESEMLARRLVEQRGLSFDYGLLGDALMEQGKLNDAAEAYQQMMNLKPDLQGYARAAHMRWLKGDLAGAIEAMQLAVSAASPSDGESAAWVNTRLASISRSRATVRFRPLVSEQLSAGATTEGENASCSKPVRRSRERFAKRCEAKSASGISVAARRGAARNRSRK